MKKLEENYFKYSEAESLRFNKEVFRAQVVDGNFNKVFEEFVQENNSLLILRFPANRLREFNISKLVALPNFFTDTLIYYKLLLGTVNIVPTKNVLEFDVWAPNSLNDVSDLVRSVFKGYKNHYHSNPNLSTEVVGEGYIEWMTSYVLQEGHEEPRKIGWFAHQEGKAVGFAACEISTNELTAEGVLYGVLPEFTGRGILTDLIRFSKRYMHDLGIADFYISTQVQNLNAQKSWIKEGFKPEKSFFTFHIYSNSF